MKMVIAYVREEAFEPIRSELLEHGFPCVTVCAAQGSGRQEGVASAGADAIASSPGGELVVASAGAELAAQRGTYLNSNVKIECAVSDGDAPTIVDTILRHARTGSIGDGKVFVLPVEQAYRIRTGEAGEDTLQAHPRVLAAH
ncbi:MAG: nitrogen regulatory protein 1 [Solirubrobacteraceae bacterium]|nr:nitrogen regulatory protein 1 [Solirubrobacteraceae bacterium]